MNSLIESSRLLEQAHLSYLNSKVPVKRTTKKIVERKLSKSRKKKMRSNR